MGLFGDFRKLTRPYEDDDEDFKDLRSQAADDVSIKPKSSTQSRNSYAGFDEHRENNKVVNIHATTQLQVVLVKPEKFENAAEIADHLRERRTVVLNLEQTNKDIARRLIDFLSGVAYAQEGKIKKVAVNTYIITPYNVDLLGDLFDELENNGLYF
jgi:cell division inhibitor SepF